MSSTAAVTPAPVHVQMSPEQHEQFIKMPSYQQQQFLGQLAQQQNQTQQSPHSQNMYAQQQTIHAQPVQAQPVQAQIIYAEPVPTGSEKQQQPLYVQQQQPMYVQQQPMYVQQQQPMYAQPQVMYMDRGGQPAVCVHNNLHFLAAYSELEITYINWSGLCCPSFEPRPRTRMVVTAVGDRTELFIITAERRVGEKLFLPTSSPGDPIAWYQPQTDVVVSGNATIGSMTDAVSSRYARRIITGPQGQKLTSQLMINSGGIGGTASTQYIYIFPDGYTLSNHHTSKHKGNELAIIEHRRAGATGKPTSIIRFPPNIGPELKAIILLRHARIDHRDFCTELVSCIGLSN